MWPGSSFRVVLDAERPLVQTAKTLDDPVVYANMADFDAAVPSFIDLIHWRVNGKPVIVRRNRNPAGATVLHRHIDPPVAESQFVSTETQSAAEDLVAEADTEE
ncbi:MAG: hypothetical protein RL745_433, partial [Actinomycetota bacterium]